jgi:hypothetical protein
VFNQPFNLLLLLWRNYLPIQSVLFHRSLYDENGGFDESLDYLEDWDLWIRYAVTTKFIFIPNITSKYRVPIERSNADKVRLNKLIDASLAIREKQKTMNIKINAADSVKEIDEIYHAKINDCIRNMKAKGILFSFLHFISVITNYLKDTIICRHK